MRRNILREEYGVFVKRRMLFILLCVFLLVLIAGLSAAIGPYPITLTDVYLTVWEGLFRRPEATHEIVIWNLRLPRIVMGVLAGAGLATAGTAMQAILMNPLASPFTIGVSAGAGFGAAVAILLGAGIIGGRYLVIGNAFVFSLIPALIIVGLTRYRRATPETMILAGIAVMYIFSALTTLLMFVSEAEAVREAYFWTVGSLGRASWDHLFPMSTIVVVCMFLLLWKSWDLNVMSAGDERAKSLGVNVERTRITVMLLACLMTAGVISFTGTIGFVGLVAPHICRMVVGGDNRFLIPASGAFGSVLLVGADTFARTILAPVILPVGVVTAFMGGLLFLYLLARGKRSEYW